MHRTVFVSGRFKSAILFITSGSHSRLPQTMVLPYLGSHSLAPSDYPSGGSAEPPWNNSNGALQEPLEVIEPELMKGFS